MAVEKSIDLTATGSSVEDAVASAVQRAALTLQGVSSFEIERIDGTVLVRVSFTIKERLHE